jgi:hypothetical protein
MLAETGTVNTIRPARFRFNPAARPVVPAALAHGGLLGPLFTK